MNKTFRVIFNHTTQQWVAVSELARVNGKKTHTQSNQSSVSGSLKKAFAPLCLALMGIFFTPKTWAAVDTYAECKYDKTSLAWHCGTADYGYGYLTFIGGVGNNVSSLTNMLDDEGKQNTLVGSFNRQGQSTTNAASYLTMVGTNNQTLSIANHATLVGNFNYAEQSYAQVFGYQNNWGNGEKTATYNGVSYINSLEYPVQGGKYSVALGVQNNYYPNSKDVGTIGDYSTAVGYQNKGIGTSSTALGNSNTASGNQSTAVGFGNTATAASASVFGRENNYSEKTLSMGTGAVALGVQNNSSGQNVTVGQYSTVVGSSNNSSNNAVEVGQYATAVGRQNTTSKNYSSAFGYKNTASGQYSSAFGSQSQAVVDYGTAIGYKSYANRAAWSSSNNYSAAFVPSDMSSFNNQQKAAWQATSAALAVGDPKGTGGTVITRQITGVAAGSEDTDAVNVAQLKELKTNTDTQITAAGTAAQDWVNAQGFAKATDVATQITAAGTAAKDWVNAQGFAKAADLPCSYDANGNLSCGKNANNGVSASTQNATVLGIGNNESVSGTTTVGTKSLAVGFANNRSETGENITVGENSTAVGFNNKASSNHSTAVGYSNTASGQNSSAVGYNNTASEQYSSAVGYNNAANAEGSSAVGYQNIANEWMSSAFGSSSQAVVAFGTAIGYKSYADRAAWDSSSNNYSAAFAPSDMSGFDAKQKAAWQATSAALAVGDPDSKGYKAPITRQITGVAAGSEDTDAVNVAQLKEVADMVGSGGGSFSPFTVSDGGSGSFTVGSAGSLKMVGSNANLSTKANGDTVTIALADDLTLTSVKTGGVQMSATGLAMSNQKITGLANGTANTDAVNLGQLNTSINTAAAAATTALNTAKSELEGKITAAETNAKGYTDTALGSYAKTADLAPYAKTADLAAYAKTSDLAPYAKTADVTSQINNAKTAASTALNNAKTDLQGKIDTANSEIGSLKTEKADKSWVTTELAKVSSGGTVDLSDYATKTYAESQANNAKTNAVTDANAYTDSKVSGLAKTSDLAPYAKTSEMNTAIDTAKSGAITNANAYTDSKVSGLAKQADLTAVQGEVGSLKTDLGTANADISTLKTDKADKSWVTTELAKVSSGGTVDLSDYATKTYAESQANAAQTNANAYTDSKLGGLAKQADLTAVQGEVGSLKTDLGNKADKTALDGKADKSWVTTELAKVSSGGAIDLSDYAQKDYADNAANTAETNAKGYTDSEMAKAKSYADTAASQAKTDAVADANAYTDTQLGDYAKTTDMTAAINTAKTDAVADAKAYTDTALTDNATQTWVNEQKFAKQQAVTDLNSRVDKLVVAGGGYEHITVSGENGSFNVANKETAKFVGDGKNITTDATGGEVKISLADDIAVNSVKVGNNGVALTANGLNNGGQVISNVAAGVRPTDAVNVSQLNHAMGGVYGRIDSMEKHANAGIAQAMASGSMASTAKPGKGMLAIAGSSYRGESGYAIGYSQMSESGKWLFRATGSGNSRGHYGVAASVGLELW